MVVDARYPIGRFQPPEVITHEIQHEWITSIAILPRQMQELVRGMADQELDTRYREAGWTVRQVVHHVADSHMNAYCRFKLALTENEPVIKPYNEARWAELNDAAHAPVVVSLELLTALHCRWVALLKSLKTSDFQRTFIHPERGKQSLNETTGLYAWHGRHHLAHIRIARGITAGAAAV
jgi:hypothetical protein